MAAHERTSNKLKKTRTRKQNNIIIRCGVIQRSHGAQTCSDEKSGWMLVSVENSEVCLRVHVLV